MNPHTAITSLTEKEEDRLPALFAAFNTPDNRVIFIGNRVAAEDPDLLFAHDITATMNLAVNIELMPLSLPDGTVVRRTHIGLIDGPGNRWQHVLAAVLALHGILGQESPGKPSYPAHRKGNVLVHCRGGRSRSATVLALYLHLAHADRFPAFEDALDHVRTIRMLRPDQPQPAMLELARQVLWQPEIKMLFD